MNRKEYLKKSLCLGICSGAVLLPDFSNAKTIALDEPDEELKRVKQEKEFIQNWLSDLLDSMDNVLDQDTKVKIIEGCGKGCFNRFKFKQDIAEKGKGSIDKLIEAYKQNFEIWRENELVHIRYGEVSAHCYCPAANYRPSKPGDVHCECTRSTHQAIFETALGRPFKVEILESLRRGGKTCHFAVHLS
jgi:hypothetical protein